MIRFETDDCSMPNINQNHLVGWIHRIAAIHGKNVGEINYLFCSDARMLFYNNQYLNHDYYTDIITFDYSEELQIAGDIYIGVDTVASNAELLNQTFERELHRVIIHGILHLCGFKDKTTEDESNMHFQEDLALNNLYQFINL